MWGLAFLAFLWLVPQASEVRHPVPLPADFDPAGCADCHAEKKEGKQVHAAVEAGCTSCHTVRSDETATLIALQAPPAELCSTCHTTQTDVAVHGPYRQGDCLLCHDPHVSEHPALARTTAQALCTACHLARRVEGATVPLFGGREISAETFRTFPKIALDRTQRIGHPYIGHPVSGGEDPFRAGQPYSCLSCHAPHAAPLVKLLREDWKNLDVCDRCHTEMRIRSTQP
ncbi:MAG: cytochrome c3 family protein [Firmicutes bacterium]|nr:cytochrome c3 family protein [Bacillota bacterium]